MAELNTLHPVKWQEYVRARKLVNWRHPTPSKSLREAFRIRHQKTIDTLEAEFPDLREYYNREIGT